MGWRTADNKLTRPWHGVPREEIPWYPVIDVDACIGCGTCVTSCGRDVYRFDFEAKKAVVTNPMNCMVACQTCTNTCPSRAISFPAVDEILRMEDLVSVHHSVEDELLSRRDHLEVDSGPPRGDLVHLEVTKIQQVGGGTRIITLSPVSEADRLCQFVPGQYLEIAVPGSQLHGPRLLDRQRPKVGRHPGAADPPGRGRTALNLGPRRGP